MNDPRPDEILEVLHTCFADVDEIVAFLPYEPKTIQDTPLMYSIYGGYSASDGPQIRSEWHRFMHRIVFSWQDPETAEAQLLRMVTKVPEAIERNPQLSAVISSGVARINQGQAGFIRIGEVTYRILEFYSEVLVKREMRRGYS